MMELNGQCSCGTVRYRMSTRELRAYQCHCSICRKATGSAFSTTVMAPARGFVWLAGEERISTYSKDGGYKFSFCSNCGSAVPNRFRGYPLYSVPAGSLDGEPAIEVVVQLHMGSKAAWDSGRPEGKSFHDMPTLDEMMALLHLDV